MAWFPLTGLEEKIVSAGEERRRNEQRPDITEGKRTGESKESQVEERQLVGRRWISQSDFLVSSWRGGVGEAKSGWWGTAVRSTYRAQRSRRGIGRKKKRKEMLEMLVESVEGRMKRGEK